MRAILLLLLSGCATLQPSALTPPQSHESPSEPSTGVHLIPVPKYTTLAERVLLQRVQDKLNEVKTSKCFHDFLVARGMIQTKGKTSKEVADHIVDLSGEIPVEMYYRRFTSAVAYRQPPSLTIHFNRKYFGLKTPLCEWVSTAAHESLGHSLGEYEHDFKWNKQRDFSVPYSLNAAVDACCKE